MKFTIRITDSPTRDFESIYGNTIKFESIPMDELDQFISLLEKNPGLSMRIDPVSGVE